MSDSAREDDGISAGLVYRHPLPVRLFHWFNVLCLLVLLMSGLQIFNAHPVLYWGEWSDPQRVVLGIDSFVGARGEPRGFSMIAGRVFDTTGALGLSYADNGVPVSRALPIGPRFPATSGSQ